MLKKVHVSVGDFNGTSAYLILKNHIFAKTICQPVYHTNFSMLKQAAKLLDLPLPDDLAFSPVAGEYKIAPSTLNAKAGEHAFLSLKSALSASLADNKTSLLTMPVNKKAWQLANINFAGHTAYFRHFFKTDLTMLLGCSKHYVALYTDHMPLKQVASKIMFGDFLKFLIKLHQNFVELFGAQKKIKANSISFNVLGFNPHAGESGILGGEDKIIAASIKEANKQLGFKAFLGPFAADSYFYQTKKSDFSLTVAIYHDQGLIGIKSLYFDESIQITLGLPVLRVSPDHGTGFDLAYKKPLLDNISSLSYQNALKFSAQN